MRLGNPIEFPHVTLRLVPEILDSVDVVLLVGKELGMVDPQVLEVRDIQHIVGLPAVGINDAVGNDFALDDRYQGIGSGVGNDLRIDPASALQQAEYWDFPRRATTRRLTGSGVVLRILPYYSYTKSISPRKAYPLASGSSKSTFPR